MLRIGFLTLALLFFNLAQAQQELSEEAAVRWLQKMGEALHKLNYDGVFVYQNGAQLSSMRLIHGYDDKGVHERLVSLTGTAREVIRNNNQVVCILPDTRSVIVERKDQSRPGFPHLLPKHVQEMRDSYRFELGKRSRVSGLTAQQIRILPKDQYRYSYHLWLDVSSGILLKAELRNEHRMIEQFMFTSLNFLAKSPKGLLTSEVNKSDFLSYTHQRRDKTEPVDIKDHAWKIGFLPSGFKLKHQQYQFQSHPQKVNLNPASSTGPVQHLVYSDGLTTISIFIETLQAAQSPMTGASPLGAINAYASMLGQTQITVVGEVPEKTVRQIAESVRYQP